MRWLGMQLSLWSTHVIYMKSWVHTLALHKLGMKVHSCILSAWVVEAGVQYHP